jgi:hypothetical protein
VTRAVTVAVVLVAALSTARADAPPLRLQIDGCVGVDIADVERIVAVEIRTTPMTSKTRANVDTTQVDVSCDGQLVVLRALDPITGKQTSRRIDLAGTPALARDRTLGLSIVELVVASWSELESVPEPAAPIVERTSSPNARGAARLQVRKRIQATRERSLRPSVSLLARAAHTTAGWAIGAGAMMRIERETGLGWGVELATHRMNAQRQRGSVGVDSTGAAVWADVHADWRGIRGRAGAGVRLELVRMTGESVDGAMTAADSFTAIGGGPLARGSLAIARGEVVVELGAEVGWRALAVRGLVTNDDDVELHGVSVSGTLALGWRW